MKLDSKKIKLFSSLGSRATFGLSCLDLIKENKDKLVVLTSDVSTSAGLDRFRKTYKDNFFDVGIAEQNLIGIASGLSHMGYNVFTTTFAPFQTMRCLEQIKINAGYMKNKFTMVGLASGVVLNTLGFTHCSIEDISIMKSIPGIAILSPSDPAEVYKSVFASYKYEGPIYIRLTGSSNIKPVYEDDYDFVIGDPIEIVKGKENMILSTGSVVSNCLQAIKSSNFPNLGLTNIHTLKPINEFKLLEILKNKERVFIFEEHSKIGGLASIIFEFKVKYNLNFKIIQTSLPDEYFSSGEYHDILSRFNLDVEGIKKVINNELN